MRTSESHGEQHEEGNCTIRVNEERYTSDSRSRYAARGSECERIFIAFAWLAKRTFRTIRAQRASQNSDVCYEHFAGSYDQRVRGNLRWRRIHF